MLPSDAEMADYFRWLFFAAGPGEEFVDHAASRRESGLAEGVFDRRLDYIAELPKGSTVWYFDKTDMHRAKDVLGDKCCIMGNCRCSSISNRKFRKVFDH